jgi:DNA-binding response OmpR family regulator
VSLLQKDGTVITTAPKPEIPVPATEQPARVEVGQFLRAVGLELDRYNHTVRIVGRLVDGAWRETPPLDLTKVEYKLLEVLLRNAAKPVALDVLHKEVWGIDFDPGTNRIPVYVRYLREKLGQTLIETKRGFGYCIPPDTATA